MLLSCACSPCFYYPLQSAESEHHSEGSTASTDKDNRIDFAICVISCYLYYIVVCHLCFFPFPWVLLNTRSAPRASRGNARVAWLKAGPTGGTPREAASEWMRKASVAAGKRDPRGTSIEAAWARTRRIAEGWAHRSGTALDAKASEGVRCTKRRREYRVGACGRR